LTDSRVGQQYLTTLDDLRDHMACDPKVKLADSSSSDVTGLPTLKSSGSATSGFIFFLMDACRMASAAQARIAGNRVSWDGNPSREDEYTSTRTWELRS
jgi:hypothetical protein